MGPAFEGTHEAAVPKLAGPASTHIYQPHVLLEAIRDAAANAECECSDDGGLSATLILHARNEVSDVAATSASPVECPAKVAQVCREVEKGRNCEYNYH